MEGEKILKTGTIIAYHADWTGYNVICKRLQEDIDISKVPREYPSGTKSPAIYWDSNESAVKFALDYYSGDYWTIYRSKLKSLLKKESIL
jgi:hypothetical protein